MFDALLMPYLGISKALLTSFYTCAAQAAFLTSLPTVCSNWAQMGPFTTACQSFFLMPNKDFQWQNGSCRGMGPILTSTKVSRSLLAYGLFSWELQLRYETMYHTELVTSFSCPLVPYITLVAPCRVFGRPQWAHGGIISSYVNMRKWCRFHLACTDWERSSLGMTNEGHVAQTLQTPVVSIVVMILHDNWGMKNRGDKAISVNTTKSNRNKWHKRHERTATLKT